MTKLIEKYIGEVVTSENFPKSKIAHKSVVDNEDHLALVFSFVTRRVHRIAANPSLKRMWQRASLTHHSN